MAVRWHELRVGEGPGPREYGPLTRTDFVRYQGASGDFNPIHHDEDFARGAGFPTVFSVGMLQAGILAGYCAEWLGADNVRRFAVQFREQVWPGDRLVCEATVARIVDRGAGDGDGDGDGERRVELDLLVTRVESGGPAIKGAATFAVP
ncbi:MAG: MaoC/PaaZ C-terminal domain-containing protein [Acidimicrobiia bacterium]